MDEIEKEYERAIRAHSSDPDYAQELATGLLEYRKYYKPNPYYADEQLRKDSPVKDVRG